MLSAVGLMVFLSKIPKDKCTQDVIDQLNRYLARRIYESFNHLIRNHPLIYSDP